MLWIVLLYIEMNLFFDNDFDVYKIEKLLKKCEKDTTKYLKKHKEEIKKLGELLLAKKNLKANEVDRIFE